MIRSRRLHQHLSTRFVLAWLVPLTLSLTACSGAHGSSQVPAASVPRHAVLLAASFRFRVCFAKPLGENNRQIVLLESSTGRTRTIGTPANYTAIRLSPNGGSLAALVTPSASGQNTTLYIWQISTGTSRAVSLPASSESTYVVWSPDGSELAVVGARTYIVTASGQQVAAAGSPALSGSYSDGGYAWSPDSTQFATLVNGDLILLDSSGRTRVTPVTSIVPAARAVGMVSLMGWVDDQAVSLAAFPSGSPAWAVNHLWSPTPLVTGEERAVTTAQPPLDPGLASRLAAAMGGAHPFVMWAHTSADDTTDVYGMTAHSAGDSPLVLALISHSQLAVVQVPVTPSQSLDGWLVDAVAADA
jgi:hypothetical protein